MAADKAVVGLEIGQVALHDVHQEADGGAAVVGFLADEGYQFLVERLLVEDVTRPGEVPAFAGTTGFGQGWRR